MEFVESSNNTGFNTEPNSVGSTLGSIEFLQFTCTYEITNSVILSSPPLAEGMRKLGVIFSLRPWRGRVKGKKRASTPFGSEKKSELMTV